MNNKILLMLGVGLVAFGLVKDDLPSVDSLSFFNNNTSVNNYVTEKPEGVSLLKEAQIIVDILKQSNSPTKKEECLKLSALYRDLSLLILLEDSPIKDTSAIREANSLCGKMLGLDIKDKYPGLADAAKSLLVSSLGDEDVALTTETKIQASEAFDALSWAFYEGK